MPVDGEQPQLMKLRKIIDRSFQKQDGGVNVAAQVSGVVNASVGESGSQRTRVSSKLRVVQRDGVTEVTEATAMPTEPKRSDEGDKPEEEVR